jgi:hypothetical protein
MRKIIFFVLLGLEVIIASCTHRVSNEGDKQLDSLDAIKYNNYLKAVRNEDTFQYFVVVTIKNRKTKEVREICTPGCLLVGALHIEYSVGYDSTENAKIENILSKNKTLYFEIEKDSALNNLGINNYSIGELETFEKTHNIDSLAKVLRSEKWSMQMPNDKTMLLYAHSLFRRGVITGENMCFGGTLISGERKKLKLKINKQLPTHGIVNKRVK